MENMGNHRDIKLVTTEARRNQNMVKKQSCVILIQTVSLYT